MEQNYVTVTLCIDTALAVFGTNWRPHYHKKVTKRIDKFQNRVLVIVWEGGYTLCVNNIAFVIFTKHFTLT